MVAVLGCGPVLSVPAAGSESGDATSGTTAVDVSASASAGDEVTGVPPSMTTSATTDATTTTNAGSSGEGDDDSVGFIQDPDGGPGQECDVWAQNCPPGEKCMPWANDGGGSWNALRCAPIAEDPGAPGEACTVIGSGVSGIDDCEFRAMCWDVDPETGFGVCVDFCRGNEAQPLCDDPCKACIIGSSAILALCLPRCDPLAQACNAGQGCYPIGDTFQCAPDASDDAGAVGDPCEYLNVCDPGNFCADMATVPGCEDARGCCASFCDVSVPDTCALGLPGTSCVPWYAQGQAPGQCRGPGVIGACLVL